MLAEDLLIWTCQYCGFHNDFWADLTVSGKQDLIEDCSICCRPNRVIISSDNDGNVFIESRHSDE